MKKIFVFGLILFIITGCGEKAKLIVPDPVEPTLEEIRKANLETAKTTLINIKNTAKLYVLELQLDSNYNNDPIEIEFDYPETIPENFVFSGIMPTDGSIIIDNQGNVITNDVVINGFTCNFNDNNEVICK